MLRLRSARKGLLLLAALVCLMAMILPVQAATTDSNAAYTTLVHYSGYEGSMVIGRMEDGAPLSILGETASFYRVDCFDMQGYIAKNQVSRDVYGNAVVRCNPDSPETVQTQYISLNQAVSTRSQVMELAMEQLGVPYWLGGTTPSGFDCSGFTSYVMSNNGFSIRRTATQQLQDTVIISRDCLLPGDLLFFSDGSSFTSHVGIYAGDNQIIHAGGRGICLADLDNAYFRTTYLCARRIINVASWDTKDLPTVMTQSFSRQTSGLRTIG